MSVLDRFQRMREVENNTDSFTNFGYEQKAAILCVLLIIANSEGCNHSDKTYFIKQVESFLGLTLEDPVDAQILDGGFEELLGILNTMESIQKEWFIFFIHLLITSDGKVDQIEVNYLLNFAESIGISEEKYILIIYKYFFLCTQLR